MKASEDDIKNHKKVKLTDIKVLRRLDLSFDQCKDEAQIRRFCGGQVAPTSTGYKTLPDMIEIEVKENDSELYQWSILVYENPNSKEGI